MFVVLTLFRGTFWCPAARATSIQQAHRYAGIIQSARGESVKIVGEREYEQERAKEQAAKRFDSKTRRERIAAHAAA